MLYYEFINESVRISQELKDSSSIEKATRDENAKFLVKLVLADTFIVDL